MIKNAIFFILFLFISISNAMAQDEPRIPQSVGEACYLEQVDVGQYIVQIYNLLLELAAPPTGTNGHIPQGVIGKWEADVRDYMLREGDMGFYRIAYNHGSLAQCQQYGNKIRNMVRSYAEDIARRRY